MAKPPKSPSSTDVENYRHESDKRRNIPTAELQKLVPDDDKAVKRLRYPRNTDLDPQLVWRGKDRGDEGPLVADAPPVYIQEKIQPRAIIEDLRRRSKARAKQASPQVDLFHDFNGLTDPEAKTEFYAHDQNWSNRMILGDSLLVMASLAEREALRGKVQMIYLDPPYGIKFNSNWQPSTKSRDVKDGKEESVSREPEVVRAFRDTWKDGIHSYLSYLRDRLTLARDLLTESGSIFVQIGDENVHLVRSLMDEVFGAANFCSLITFIKTSSQTDNLLASVSDYLVWYAKDIGKVKYRQLYKSKSLIGEGGTAYNKVMLPSGSSTPVSLAQRLGIEPLPDGTRIYRIDNLTSQSPGTKYDVVWCGRTFFPKGYWKTEQSLMQRLLRATRVEATYNALYYVRYFDDFPVFPYANNWDDTSVAGFASDKRYVVETSTKVVERCLLMTTDPGDLVLDPTCGSGTMAFVAEHWGRRWITIDTSRVALTLARARLMGAKYDYYLLKDSAEGATKEGELTGKPPVERRYSNDIREGFVYERAPHVTLKSIANNAEIDVIYERWQKVLEPLRAELNAMLFPSPLAGEGAARSAAGEGTPHPAASRPPSPARGEGYQEWQIPREAEAKWSDAAKALHAKWWEGRRARQKEIDDSIARNADVEMLYDRPYKARGVVRVAGPFTVESLSPHRILPLGEDPYLAEALLSGEEQAATPLPPATAPETDFAQVVYENLKSAGVQNTKKGERLTFEWIKPFVSKSKLIAFEGRYKEGEAEKRAAIVIGPEYDTVGYELVRRAAREAADLFDTLIVCGFAFAPEVDESRLNFGALTVLKARMNQDLRMGDRLKATGAGNLFVVFGEPDIRINHLPGDMIAVEIKGMDIFDPTTGEVRSSGGKELMNDVAAWFIDDDYDDESFFVRQAYFVGQDPYEGLRRALKADIDETAWAEINSTISQPFRKPASGKICVKVINHFGDEVQKVFVV